MSKKVAIVGGGASGLMAAIEARTAGATVFVYEKNDRVGKKLLATGNGRCNLTNLDMRAEYYNSDSDWDGLVDKTLHAFSALDLCEWFKQHGILTKDKNGYVYPYSEQASTVLDGLRYTARRLGVVFYTQQEVVKVERVKHGYELETSNHNTDVYDIVILCCGSYASLKSKEQCIGYQLATSLGHSMNQISPALVQIRCNEKWLASVAGVRTEGKVTLLSEDGAVAEEYGELQWTDYGLSGIPVFQLSRNLRYKSKKEKWKLRVDLFSNYSKEEFKALVEQRLQNINDLTLEEWLLGMANKKMNIAMMKLQGLKPDVKVEKIDTKTLRNLLYSYRNIELSVVDTRGYENAQVCAGGILLSEINDDFSSKLLDGLYLCGEMLDVDGKCGGYNLQWAFSSGMIAGRSAARE